MISGGHNGVPVGKVEGVAPKFDFNGSERHREVWNLTAKELDYSSQWVQDKGLPHQIDVEQGDLELSLEDRTKFGLAPNTPIQGTPLLWQALQTVSAFLETTRKNLLTQSLEKRKEVESVVDISHLTEGEKQVLKLSQGKIVPLANRLRFLQMDPRFPEWEKRIRELANNGDLLSVRQWGHTFDDRCFPTITDPRCSVFTDFPNKRPEIEENPVWTTVPQDVTLADVETMKKAWLGEPKRNPFFSSFTVIEKGEDGTFKWTPFSLHPMTKGLMSELSRSFDEASKIKGIAPSLAKQFETWGRALRSREAYPFDEAERLTVAQNEGNLEVTLDASPGFPPFNKSGISMLVGVVRQGEDTFAKKYVLPILQALENRLGALLPGLYKSRKLKENIPVRFVDLVVQDATIQQVLPGEILAYKYPVGTKVSEDEGSAKRVVAVNHNVLKFEHIYRPLAKEVLDPKQIPLVTQRGVETFLVLHEMSHGIGPEEGTKTLKGGTVGQDLGALNGRLEEAKADTGGMSAIPKLRRKGSLDENRIQEIYVSWVVGLIRQMRTGGRLHGGAASMSFGYLCDQGAVTVVKTDQGDRFRVVFEKLPQAIERLWAAIVKLQMKGDAKEAQKFIETYAKKIPSVMDEMTERFTKLGLPADIKIRYRLKG